MYMGIPIDKHPFSWLEQVFANIHGKCLALKLSNQLFLLIFTAIISTSSYARPIIQSPVLTHLSPNQGSSQANINSMIIDKDGFLWLATDVGLKRSDGYSLIHVDGHDGILANAEINYIFQDRKQKIWLSTAALGVYTLSPKTGKVKAEFSVPYKKNPTWIQTIQQMVQLGSGEFLFALNEQIVQSNEDGSNLHTIFSLSDIQIDSNAVLKDISVDDEWLYIAVSDGLYVQHLPSSGQKKLALFNPATSAPEQLNVKELHLDSLGRLWIGAVAGLYSIGVDEIQAYFKDNLARVNIEEEVAFRNIWEILETPDGLYLATDDGLYFFRPEDQSLKHILRLGDSRFQVSNEEIKSLIVDANNNIWMTTGGDGAFYWSPRSLSFKNYYAAQDIPNSLSNDHVLSLYQDQQQSVWVGTNNGLDRLDYDTLQFSSYLLIEESKSALSASTISQIMPAQDDNHLWIVSARGLLLFDKVSGTASSEFVSSPESKLLVKSEILNAALDSQNNIWMRLSQGLFKVDVRTGDVQALKLLSDQLQLDRFIAFLGEHEHFPGKMLISMVGGLWSYDIKSGDMQVIHRLDDNLIKPFVAPNKFVIDKHKIIWIAYSGAGLYGLDASSFEVKYHYNKDKYLPSNMIFGLQLDDSGNLWMSSLAGLIRLDVDTQQVQQFTNQQGLRSNEFNQAAYYKLQDGNLAYGSSKGFTIFNPLLLSKPDPLQQSHIAITEVDILSTPINWPLTNLNGRIVDMKHDDVGLSIKFSSLKFANAHNTQYQYQLVGEQTLSSPPIYNNEVFFPKLNSGNYIFSVQTLGSNSSQKLASATLLINVAYPPWQSPQAYYSYALIIFLMVLVWSWLKYRARQKMLLIHAGVKQSEQRMQLALATNSSGVWDWQAVTNELNQPRICLDLGYPKNEKSLKIEAHIALIHPQEKNLYEQQWQQFIEQDQNTLDITYRLKNTEGNWQWYRDLGRVIKLTPNGKAQSVVGTYTNVTESIANEQKARLFGEAFKQTRDWVFILDKKRKPLAVNEAFSKAFGLDANDESPNSAFLLMINRTSKWMYYDQVMTELTVDSYWQEEDIISMPDGQKHEVLVKINAVADENLDDSNVAFYVFVMTDINQQKAAEKKLRHLANYDDLTQLPNRSLLLSRIEHAIDYASRRGSQFALFFIDIDKFKQVNDSLGHDAGDSLLTTISQRLTSITRAEDTVARLGGDEFVLLMENFKKQEVISDLAEKIMHEVNLPISIKEHELRITASIGIAVFPQDADTPAEMLKHADMAMYHAKEKNNERFQFFSQSMNQQALERLNLHNKLRKAVEHDQFVNYYQPIIDFENKITGGFELLMRWQSDNGMVSPADFIPASEDLGLIIPMTWRAIEKGIVHLASWQETGATPYLSINLSARHIEQGFNVERLLSLIGVFDLPVEALRFEITESALMRNQEQSLKSLNALHEAGFILSLDDFGTGYSSLKYLREFPIQYIKIDQSFVSDIGLKQSTESIIVATLMMAEGLDMDCVAEGIETTQQIEFFTRHKCNLLQGYIFSRPVPFEKTQSLLAQKWDRDGSV
ncbi:MAG: diguanylate cyclase (GGDEF)-like protein [Paraglaciecola sp.]|jgi:diguanylate cyclase (GGDEF)-like protein